MERLADNTETWRLTDRRDDVYFVDRPELDEIRIPGLWIFPVRLNRLEKAAQERFHLKLLSEHLQGEPARAASVKPAAQAIRQVLDRRLQAVNAYLQVAHSENPITIKKSDLPDVKVVNELTVRFRLPDRALSDGVKRDAYHARNDSGWVLWLNGGLFDGEGKPAQSVWDYVASALVYAGDLPLDAQPCVKDLLLYEGLDLRRKLLSLGVTEETVSQIIPAPPTPMARIRGRHRQSRNPSRRFPEMGQESSQTLHARLAAVVAVVVVAANGVLVAAEELAEAARLAGLDRKPKSGCGTSSANG